MLLFIGSSKEVSLAITGGLLTALFNSWDNVTGGEVLPDIVLDIPVFNSLKIGYSEDDDLAGIMVVLDENKSFKINYSFEESKSLMKDKDFIYEDIDIIDPENEAIENGYEDIDVIEKVALNLNAEFRIKTKSERDGYSKSDAISALEALIEGLVGMEEGSVEFDLQDTIITLGINIGAVLNLEDLSQTNLAIDISYNDTQIVTIYFVGSYNKIYADMSQLGLFKVSLTGIDVMSLLADVFTEPLVVDGEGINVVEMLNDLLSGENAQEEIDPENGDENGTGEEEDEEEGDDPQTAETTQDIPTLTLLLSNEEIILNPNTAVLNKFLEGAGIKLPNFTDIRLSLNTKEGLNNLAFNMKIDNLGNNINLTVPTGGLSISFCDSDVNIPSVTTLSKYGGLTGLTYSKNGGFNADMIDVINSAMDGIDIYNLEIFLDKRTDYWERKDYYSCYPPANTTTGPFVYPDNDAGYDGVMTEDTEALLTTLEVLETLSHFADGLSWGDLLSTITTDPDKYGPDEPIFYRNRYRRGKLKLNKTTGNAIQIGIQTLSWETGTTTVYLEKHKLLLVLGSQFNIKIPVINISIPLAKWGNSLLSGMTGADAYSNEGILLPLALYPEDMFAEDEASITQTGRLYGQITDENDDGVEGMKITILDKIAYTDENGYYYFLDLPAIDCLGKDEENEEEKSIIDFFNSLSGPNSEDKYYIYGTREFELKGGFYYELSKGYEMRIEHPTRPEYGVNIKSGVMVIPKEYSKVERVDYQVSTTLLADVTIYGYIREAGTDNILPYTTVYYNDSKPIVTANSEGYYSINFKIYNTNEQSSQRLKAVATGHDTLTKYITGIALDGSTQSYQIDFSLVKNADPTYLTIIGKLKDENGNPIIEEPYEGNPEYKNIEIWIRVNSNPTLGVSDFYDIIPYNFAEGKISSDGTFTLTSYIVSDVEECLYLPLDATYTIKFRSPVFDNYTTTFASTTANASSNNYTYYMNDITLNHRVEHWSENEPVVKLLQDLEEGEEPILPAMISKIRIRLGADILDGEEHNHSYSIDDSAWDGDEPYNDYVDDMGNLIYEGGVSDRYNDYTYIEVWPESSFVNDLLLKVETMLFGMIGVNGVEKGKLILPIDISIGAYNELQDEDGNPKDSKNYDRWQGKYNEDDGTIYNPLYLSKGAYYQAMNSALAKISGGFIHWAIATVLEEYLRSAKIELGGYSLGVIDLIAAGISEPEMVSGGIIGPIAAASSWIPYVGGLISAVLSGIKTIINQAFVQVQNLLDDASNMISHALPINLAYNMFETMDMYGSPLYNYYNNGDLEETTRTEGEISLRRDVKYYDLSVYAKITLDASADVMLDRITLFINSATFINEQNDELADEANWMEGDDRTTQGDWTEGYWKYSGRVGDFGEGQLTPTGINYGIRSCNIQSIQTIAAGVTNEANQQLIDAWIRTNNVNSYLIIDDYATDDLGKEYVYNRKYVYDNEANPKEDFYQELDINNTGINFRVLDSIGSEFYQVDYNSSGISFDYTVMTPPEMIQFHDPYDLTDFTAYGGSWVGEGSGISQSRTNNLPNVTIDDILPNRNFASFTDGNSRGSQGIAITWDIDSVDINPNGITEDDNVYLPGYILNLTYSNVKVIVDPFDIDPNSSNVELLDIPPINEPRKFNENEYIASLPHMFIYQYSNMNREKTYIFDQLTWEFDTEIVDGIKQYSSISYTEENPYIWLTYSYTGSGIGAAKVKIPIEIADMRAETVHAISETKEIDGETVTTNVGLDMSINGIESATGSNPDYHGVVYFSPFECKDPYTVMENIDYINVDTLANTQETDWKIIKDSFEAIANDDGSILSNYDASDLSGRSYEVRYKIKDNIGFVQTIKIRVIICSKELLNTSLTKNVTVIPYTNYKGEEENILQRLNLPDSITLTYGDNSTETVSIGDNFEIEDEIILIGGEVQSVTIIKGETLSWMIPKMDYEGGTYTAKALIGGTLTKYELDKFVTEIKEENKNNIYNENTCIIDCWNELYNNNSREKQSQMNDVYQTVVEENTDYSSREAKVEAWKQWYDKLNDRAKLDLDEMLFEKTISYTSVSDSNAKITAWDKTYAYSYKNELDAMKARVEKNNPGATEVSIKEVAWTIQLRETSNTYQKSLMNNIIYNIEKSSPEDLHSKATAWDTFYGASTETKAEFDNLYELIEKANEGLSTKALKQLAWDTWYNEYTSDDELLEVKINVEPRNVIGFSESIVKNPNTAIELGNLWNMRFDETSLQHNVYVEWIGLDENALVNNFKGKIFYLNAEIIDPIFGNQYIKNVRIAIQQLDIIGIKIAVNNIAIDPYNDQTIYDFLAQYNEINNYGDRYNFGLEISNDILWNNPEISDEEKYWEFDLDENDIPVWRFANEEGISFDGKNFNKIIVTVQNRNYDENPIWCQDVIINLENIIDRTIIGFKDQFATSERIDLLINKTSQDNAIWTIENNILTINDAYNMVDINKLYIEYVDNSYALLDAQIDMGDFAESFYGYEEFDLIDGIRIGNKTNNMQIFDIHVENNSPRIVYVDNEGNKDISFYYDEDCTSEVDFDNEVYNVYDNIDLPGYAEVKFVKNSASEILNLDVVWTHVNPYNNESTYTTATAKIGNEKFGYIYHTITINLSPETIDIEATLLPDELSIFPYLSLYDQLSEYLLLTVNTDLRSNIELNVKVDDIDFANYKANGFVEQVYDIDFNIGITTDFDTSNGVSNFEIRQPKTISVSLREMIAQSIDTQLVGSIYDKIDFNDYQTVTVMFSKGAIEGIHLDWNLSNLQYTYLGGVCYVQAILEKGTDLEQKFDVPIQIQPTQLSSLSLLSTQEATDYNIEFNRNMFEIAGDNSINRLLIEPFDGFVGLPTMIKAHFKNSEEIKDVYVDWKIDHIADYMSISGGTYTKAKQNAAIATIYIYETKTIVENGVEKQIQIKTAYQSIEVDVYVYNRSIIQYQASYSEEGDNYKVIDNALGWQQGDPPLFNVNYLFVDGVLPINPYEKEYSEDFDSENFAYFKRVRLILNNNDEYGNPYSEEDKFIEFDLEKKNYEIYDKKTGDATNLNNLYTGRDVIVNIRVNVEEDTAAEDCKQLQIGKNGKVIEARIMDMTYLSGLDKDEYYIDVYGAISEKDGNIYTTTVEYEETALNKTIFGKDSERFGNLACYTFEEITYDGDDINNNFIDGWNVGSINYKSGTGRLYAKIGNDFGGQQNHIININYIDRTVESLFEIDANIVPNYELVTDEDGISYYSFVFDPFLPYLNTTEPLEDGVQGYLKGGSQATTVTFTDGTTLDLSSDQNINGANVSVIWGDGSFTMRYFGGDYNVKGSIGEGNIKQTIRYPVHQKSRKVKSSVDYFGHQEGFEGIFKDGAEDVVLRVYDYLDEPNITAAIGNDLFVNPNNLFRVYFDGFDDEYMEFSMGNYAGNEENEKIVVKTYKGLGVDRVCIGTYELGEEETGENALLMSFAMDPSKPLSYRGGIMRFFITLPGFALGEDGQQKATVFIKIEEQYIATIKQGEEDNHDVTSATNIEIEGKDQAIQYTAGQLDSYHITNPYYYIKQGGIPMPDYIWIYVTSEAMQARVNSGSATVDVANMEVFYHDEEGTKISEPLLAYYTEALWSGGSRGRVTVNYYDETVSTTTCMDIDNQPFTFNFTSTPWVFGGYESQEALIDPRTGELATIDAFNDDTKYGPEDVILMPEKALISLRNRFDVVYNDPSQPNIYPAFDRDIYSYDENYGFKVEFGTGQEEYFLDITGGGNYYNNYNKWYFGDVSFGIGTTQYAYLTLGGRGGQVVRWSFPNLSTRKWVNTNVPSIINTNQGVPTGGGQEHYYTFSKTFNQYLSYGTAAQGLDKSVDLPLTISNFRTPTGEDINPVDNMPGVLPEGINQTDSASTIQTKLEAWYQSDSKKIVKHKFTTAENQYYPGYLIAMVDWGIDQYCAYPEDTDDIGGTIILAAYDTSKCENLSEASEDNDWRSYDGYFKNNFNSETSYIVHPDHSEAYPNSPLCVDGSWNYPSDLQDGGYDDSSTISGYYYNSANTKTQNSVPIIEVERGTRFELYNLPLLQIQYQYSDAVVDDYFDIDWLDFWATTTKTKTVTYMPWQNANAYYMGPTETGWNHGDDSIYPPDSYYGTQLDGYWKINTYAEAGTIYTISTEINLSSTLNGETIDFDSTSVVVRIRLID